jgi:hypothetical protein
MKVLGIAAELVADSNGKRFAAPPLAAGGSM